MDIEAKAEALSLLLTAISSVAGRERLRFFHGMLRRSDKFTREKQLNAKNLEQLDTDLRGGVFSTLIFYERPARDRDMNVPGLTFTVDMVAKSYVGHARFPYQVEVNIPASEIASEEALTDGFAKIMSILESPYGFVHVGEGWDDVAMEISAVPIHSFVPSAPFKLIPDDPDERERHERLQRYQLARNILGEKIRGAYWGNFLGNKLVAALGGRPSIEAHAPAAKKVSLADDGIYLQATSDLSSSMSEDGKQAISKLGAYLRPISIG